MDGGLKQSLSGYALAQEGLGNECKSLAYRDLTAAPVFARLLRKAAESMRGKAAEELTRHFDKVKEREEDLGSRRHVAETGAAPLATNP